MAARGSDQSGSTGSKSGSKSNKSGSKGGSKDILTPSDISKSMKGDTVKIKGELEYRKEASDNKFYRLSGGDSNVIVRSEHSIPEGRRILNGEVELIKGNICVYVEE
jgi:ribosomal protein L6P/L9E